MSISYFCVRTVIHLHVGLVIGYFYYSCMWWYTLFWSLFTTATRGDSYFDLFLLPLHVMIHVISVSFYFSCLPWYHYLHLFLQQLHVLTALFWFLYYSYMWYHEFNLFFYYSYIILTPFISCMWSYHYHLLLSILLIFTDFCFTTATCDDTIKLWKNIEPHLKRALQTVYLREVSRYEWLLC